ncbi:MAG: hypothetical protein U0796_19125 [Gemmatales bacterium]
MNWRKLREINKQKREAQKHAAREIRELAEQSDAGKRAERIEIYIAGYETGMDWYKEGATDTQLNRLKGCQDELSKSRQQPKWHQYFVDNEGVSSNRCRMKWLALLIEPRTEADKFWKSAIGAHWKLCVREAAFLQGFCEGALQAWKNNR